MKSGVTSLTQKAAFTASDRHIYYFFKRLLDIFFSIIGLVICAPLFVLIYLAIRLESSGSPIFTQERVGAFLDKVDGRQVWTQKHFNMYKFRTMRADASSKVHQEFIKAYIAGDEAKMAALQASQNDQEQKYKLQSDTRITRVGRFLRKTSLDELPQLINVLIGQMTLVGPRPPIPYEVAMYSPEHHERLNAKQGITGYWQVSGRNSISFEDMVKLDAQYINDQSILLDLKIIFKTFSEVFYKQKTA